MSRGSFWRACAVSLVLTGCVPKSDGEAMQNDLAAQAKRIKTLEQASQSQVEQLKTAEKKAQESIDELEDVLERATSVVKRNSADVTVTVSELQQRMGEVDGRIAELQHALEELTKAQKEILAQLASGKAAPVAKANTEPPPNKTDHYAAAYRAYTDRKFAEARGLFRKYIEKYPKDNQSDNAQYWIGASYLVENRPATALSELRRVIETYRSGDAVDEALLDMAEAFYRLKACDDAKDTLKALVRSQPKSQLIKKAKERLRYLRRPPRGTCK